MTGFLDANRAADSSSFVLVPVPYEQTTTYRKGTANGPRALLDASWQIETYDAETMRRPGEAGIHVTDPVTVSGMPDELAPRLQEVVAHHLDAGRLVGCIGGEHSISLGAIRAATERHAGLGVLQIDAHPDLRDEYEGTRFGHGCVMRRVLDDPRVGALVGVGLRAVSEDDRDAIAADARTRPFFAYELATRR
ncbi:MAG: arginase family protein, partial [Planctomycetota bacterium]|nr:arginase family protein [Planctomycetota bacterium]